MRRAILLGLGCVLALHVAISQTKPAPTKQIERGRDLFAKSTKGTPCGTCHQMGGVGNAVAPDLTPLASFAIPRGLVTAIHWTIPEKVQEVTTPEKTFFGIPKPKTGGRRRSVGSHGEPASSSQRDKPGSLYEANNQMVSSADRG